MVPDADGLNDRQMFDFPPEQELLLDELVPIPPDTPDLLQTFLLVATVRYTSWKEMHTLNISILMTGWSAKNYAPRMKMYKGSFPRLVAIVQG